MRNVRLTISYDGTNYCGWQRQKENHPHLLPPKSPHLLSSPSRGEEWKERGRIEEGGERGTIQGTIEERLEKLLQEKIKLTGSGRTDSGVHAFGQVANFKTKSTLSLKEIGRGLNALLPKDIRIKRLILVPERFNSRYDLLSKTYHYVISRQDSPFLLNYAYFCPYKLDLSAMKKASGFLIGKHNFSSFQAAGSKIKKSVRSIKKLSIRKKKTSCSDLITIKVEASGFLYKMVRNIVGTLLEVGKGKIAPEELKKILHKKDRKFAGPTAPAKGLYLKRVKY